MNIPLNRKLLLFGLLGIIVILIIATPFFSIVNPGVNAPPNQLPVAQIIPDPTVVLYAEQKQNFKLELARKVNQKDVVINLFRIDQSKDAAPIAVPNTISFSKDNRTITIEMNETVLQNNIYFLQVTNTRNQVIYRAEYTSAPALPTAAPQNNLELAKYLPYQTSTYLLKYNTYLNVYEFIYIYDPNSPDEPAVQREKAETDARAFIQSKEINPSTLIINWDTK